MTADTTDASIASFESEAGSAPSQWPNPKSTHLLQVNNLRVEFKAKGQGKKEPFVAVDNVDMSVDLGQIVGLVGESGSGKSTIARCVSGLNDSYSGELIFDGRTLGNRRERLQWRQIQMVFQDPYASLDPRLTVRKMLREIIRYHSVVISTKTDAYCEYLLNLVQLPLDLLDALPSQMSGGQRQRVAIARALAVRPWLIIADEATAALDVSAQADIIDLLLHLREELGLSILFISHDLNVVRSICEKVYVVYHGKLVDGGPTEQVYTSPASDYTRKLLAAVPTISSAYVSAITTSPIAQQKER